MLSKYVVGSEDPTYRLQATGFEKRFSPEQNAKGAEKIAKRHFTYFICPARAGFLEHPTEKESAVLQAHFQYLMDLQKKGTLVLAGRCTDPAYFPEAVANPVAFDMQPSGIVIFEAADEAEAVQIMEGDPAVAAGVFKARVHVIGIALQRDVLRSN